MPDSFSTISRRRFIAGASAAGIGLAAAQTLRGQETRPDPAADDDKALIAITLDLEMSRHYPTWDVMHWDYEKGNLNQPAKEYTVEACRRVRAAGGVLQSFVLGRVFEQENVDWIKEIVRTGHPVGNHTYDHVNVWTKDPNEIQFRFTRAPWLIEGKTVPQVIVDNIRLTDEAMKTRVGVKPVGFRTPGGSGSGLIGRPDVQQILLDLGFTWVSSMAKSVPIAPQNPTQEDFQRVALAQEQSQPFVYPSGLIEIPMSPLGDVACFRREKEKWKLADFLGMVEAAVAWTIEHAAVFDLLGHPSIMYVEDPEFKTYELICRMVNEAGDRAAIVGLDTIARRVKRRHAAAASSASKTG
jgi:peptidoglycan/xylan/chitin deacetylase (PgdA/CDA1 family)